MNHPNSPARSLRIISLRNGWDPGKIWNQEKGAYDGNFHDYIPDVFDRDNAGKWPGDALGDMPPVQDKRGIASDQTEDPKYSQKVTWNKPDTGSGIPDLGKKTHDPTPAEPGA